MTAICIVGQILFWAIIVRIVLDWVRVPSDHPVGQLRNFLAQATDPVLRPLRNLIPPVRMGGMGLDLSPLIVIIGLQLILQAIC